MGMGTRKREGVPLQPTNLVNGIPKGRVSAALFEDGGVSVENHGKPVLLRFEDHCQRDGRGNEVNERNVQELLTICKRKLSVPTCPGRNEPNAHASAIPAPWDGV